jgi:predicted HicB family RNase H-like nuclease
MNNILEYMGYYTKIEYSSEDRILHGRIEGIGDLITFQSAEATKIEEEFQNAIDDYLTFCEEVGKDPDKSYKGSFNIRINPDLHKKLAIKAFKNNESLNQTVENAIREYLKTTSEVYNELFAVYDK